MAAGDDRYLPSATRARSAVSSRDFIDSGWHLGEAVMPAMVLVILATFIPVPAIQYYSFIGLWIFILFVIGDMIISSIRVKQAARQEVRRRPRREGPRLVRRDAHHPDAVHAPAQAAGQARRSTRSDPAPGADGSACGKPAVDLPRPERAAVEERRVALHEGGARIQPLPHVGGGLDAADRDHAELGGHRRAHEPQHLERAALQRRAGQPAGRRPPRRRPGR